MTELAEVTSPDAVTSSTNRFTIETPYSLVLYSTILFKDDVFDQIALFIAGGCDHHRGNRVPEATRRVIKQQYHCR